jgi:hypothetical protein
LAPTAPAASLLEALEVSRARIALEIAAPCPALALMYDNVLIPREVRERLEEIANICNLVAGHFGGDARKTALWFRTKNAMLGDISPRDMLRYGRYERRRRFVIGAIGDDVRNRKASERQAQASASGGA